jgi:hypothetical protein
MRKDFDPIENPLLWQRASAADSDLPKSALYSTTTQPNCQESVLGGDHRPSPGLTDFIQQPNRAAMQFWLKMHHRRRGCITRLVCKIRTSARRNRATKAGEVNSRFT